MSIVHCDYCNTNIDTDYDVEHFVNDDMDYCIEEEEQQYDSHMEAKYKLEDAAPDLLEVVLGWREAFIGRVLMKVDNEEDKKFLLELIKKAEKAIKKATL